MSGTLPTEEFASHLTRSTETLSPEEAQQVAPYFTNADRSVVALTNLPEVVKGALFSRYSRSSKGVRRLFLDEFMGGMKETADLPPVVGGEHSRVARQRAEAFYARVLSEYGDDSVGELGGAHIAFQEISQLAAKRIEDHRVGLAFLEKSSRYVPFDDKVAGHYRYYRDRTLLDSRFGSRVVATLDGLFDAYSAMLPRMMAHIESTFPIDDVEFENGLTGEVQPYLEIGDEDFKKSAAFAYRQSVRAQACDLLRCFLPMATLTNVGVWGNGRALEYIILNLLADPLPENRWLARAAQHELDHVIGPFVRRADDAHGRRQQEYLRATRAAERRLAERYLDPSTAGTRVPLPAPTPPNTKVMLVHYDADAVEQVAAAILFPASSENKTDVLRAVMQLSPDELKQIVEEYTGTRENRRNKPGRAFEHARYEFDLLLNIGEFRDLQRHRLVTPQRQGFTTAHGYETNSAILEVPEIRAAFDANMEQADAVYRMVSEEYPEEAQYLVPYAYRVRYNVEMNLRELYHWVELRTSEHGHPDYRITSQQMFQAVQSVHPMLVQGMQFVNLKPNAPMSRLRAEMRSVRRRLEQTAKQE
ncbi:MAG: FAD-dependent thymidylate synthase [Rudaea sp.]